MRKIVLYVALICCLSGASVPAEAGGVRYPCDTPLVFEGADISNYIGAFDGISSSVTYLDALGAELSLLVQFDALYSQVGLGSIGAVQLVPEPGEHVCSDESIMDKLLGKLEGARGEIKDGGGIILFSGRFEIVGDDVYLISRVGFVRKGLEEMVLIRGREGSDASALVGVLPRNEITFSPRRLNKQRLVNINEAYDKYIRVRRERSLDVDGRRIDALGPDVAAFFIKGISHGWLEIEWYGSHTAGYVKVPEQVGQLGLRELMPELYFMEATAVYLSLMVRGRDLHEGIYERRVQRFDSLRNTFERYADGRSDREALALLDAMSGFLHMERAKNRRDVAAAAERFARAAKQMPANTNALMLDILGQHAASTWKPNQRPQDVEAADLLVAQKLARLIDIDPRNDTAKLNFATKVKVTPMLQTPQFIRLQEFIVNDEKLQIKRSAQEDLRRRGSG